MGKSVMITKTVYNNETYTDAKGRERQKTVCIKEFTIGENTYYARGSTVRSLIEDYNEDSGLSEEEYFEKRGRAIANIRADKVLAKFAKNPHLNYKVIETKAWTSHLHMSKDYSKFPKCMVGGQNPSDVLSDLEKKLMGLDK